MLFPRSSSSPAAVIGAAGAELASLDGRLWAAASDDALLDAVTELESLQSGLAALRAHLLSEVSQRELPRKQLAWASTTEWYAHLAGVTLGEARRTVVQAPLLTGERDATLRALSQGEVSPAKAAIVCDAVDLLPLAPSVRAEGERVLLEEAGRLNATDLRKAARHLAEVVDPDRSERRAEAELAREERSAHLGRQLTITDDGAGGIRLRGRGSVEDGAVLRAALVPLTKPTPALDPDDAAGPRHDPRDHGARLWDAFVEVAQHALDTERPPHSHGVPARVSVLIDLDRLRDQLSDVRAGEPVTDDGRPLSAAAVRRLACDADLVPVCLDTEGRVLDVGRTQRLVTVALWLALLARDRHCTFPGCTRPPVMCHAHHVHHWADGGGTALDNLVLLCGAHHRTIHDTPWQVRLSPAEGHPEFRAPPPRRGGPQPSEWIRHRPRRE